MTLYDLQGEYLRLYEMATDEDDEQAFLDTLESLDAELEAKSNGYARIIKMLEMEAEECNKAIETFQKKKEIRENHVKRMKEALISAMDVIGKDTIKAGEYTLKVSNNGGQQPLKIDGEVPANYLRIKYEPDNGLIRKAIAEGKELGFAHLEPRGRHITIK